MVAWRRARIFRNEKIDTMLYPWHIYVNHSNEGEMMIKLKLLKNILHHKAGEIISVDSDNEGNLKDNFWARRLKDSEVDGCVEVVQESTVAKSHKKNEDKA